MTIYEYCIRLKAHRLKCVDRDYEIHSQAWANWNVQATKNQGKHKKVPVYGNFKKFFDYEGRIEEITASNLKAKPQNAMAEILRIQEERRVGGGEL